MLKTVSVAIATGGGGSANSGVVAGTYGSGQSIPIVTVNSAGDVTRVITAPVGQAPGMNEIEYYYTPANINKSASGTTDASTGAGNGMTDLQTNIWSVNSDLLLGTCDAIDNNQFKRDQLILPAAAPSGVNQTFVFDIDSSSTATTLAQFRRTTATSGYFCGTNNDATGTTAGQAQINVYNTGNVVTTATGVTPSGVSGHSLRVTASVSETSNVSTITCSVIDLSTGVVVSSCSASDSTASLQAGSASALVTTKNLSGSVVSPVTKVQRLWNYDQTATAVPRYIVGGIDSLTYGQQCSDAGTNGGTISGNNPLAIALTTLGIGWKGANLGLQGAPLALGTTTLQTALPILASGREQQWVVTMGGVNDIGFGGNNATATAVETSLTSLCNAARLVGWKVMLSTILPLGANCTVYNSFGTNVTTINSTISNVNSWILSNWKTIADGVVDPASNTNLSSFNATYYNSDQLHLNDAGSLVYGTLIAGALVGQLTYGTSEFLISQSLPNIGTVGSVTFSSIPNVYRDLRAVARGSGQAASSFVTITATLNGDNGANYDYEQVQFNGNTVTAVGAVSQNSIFIGWLPGASGVANSSSSGELIVRNYKDTSLFKTVEAHGGVRTGSTGNTLFMTQTWADWKNTAAVNSITITASSGNFTNNTIITLYGIG